jgi:hypothetical protein
LADLHLAWIAKEHPRDLLALRITRAHSTPAPSVVRDRWTTLLSWCAEHDHIPELVTFATTLDAWSAEIINAVLTGASNAGGEGVNRVQKLDFRAAFSYRNPDNQRRRARTASRRCDRRPQRQQRLWTTGPYGQPSSPAAASTMAGTRGRQTPLEPTTSLATGRSRPDGQHNTPSTGRVASAHPPRGTPPETQPETSDSPPSGMTHHGCRPAVARPAAVRRPAAGRRRTHRRAAQPTPDRGHTSGPRPQPAGRRRAPDTEATGNSTGPSPASAPRHPQSPSRPRNDIRNDNEPDLTHPQPPALPPDCQRSGLRSATTCPVCPNVFTPTRRQRYCTPACRQAAWRARHRNPSPTVVVPPTTHRRRVTVYRCPECDTRYWGDQWCHDCHQPCLRVDIGGLCPECEEPVTVRDLLDQHPAPH